MYEVMRAANGPQGWWPGDGALEVCVGAILTQNTNWANVERAIGNLKAAGLLDEPALRALPPARLARLIRPAGYFNVKARRLRAFLAAAEARGVVERLLSTPVRLLRTALLAIDGIGPETADSIVLYAAGKPTFVVDAYTRRIGLRHGFVRPGEDYETIRARFESHLPRRVGLWQDYHAQLVCVGKRWCRPRPGCAGCPLARFGRPAAPAPAPPSRPA